MLWLSLSFPSLSVDVASIGYKQECKAGDRIPPARAIYSAHTGKHWIYACNREAAAKGVRSGMSAGAALSLCDDLLLLPRDERAEYVALEGLALWAGSFTSLLSLETPLDAPPSPPWSPTGADALPGMLLEIGGSLALFGDIDALRTRIADGLDELGYPARMAVAPTPLGAWLLCRAGHQSNIRDLAALESHVRALPIKTLAREKRVARVLHGLGLRTLGDCLRLPRGELRKRIGTGFLHDLDRALGRVPDPRPGFRFPEYFERHIPLPAPVEHSEALLFVARRLLLELRGFLYARDAAIQSFVLELKHHGGNCSRLEIGLVAPSRDHEHLHDLLRQRLEHYPLAAPVELIGIRADTPLPFNASAGELFAHVDGHAGDWVPLLERLRQRLGEQNVHGLSGVAEHRPEYAWRASEPAHIQNFTDPRQRARPLWLLKHPVPLRVVMAQPWLDGMLTPRYGPERIESGWWDDQDIARDYFIADNPYRQRLWIYRELDAGRRWFLHGIFS